MSARTVYSQADHKAAKASDRQKTAAAESAERPPVGVNANPLKEAKMDGSFEVQPFSAVQRPQMLGSATVAKAGRMTSPLDKAIEAALAYQPEERRLAAAHNAAEVAYQALPGDASDADCDAADAAIEAADKPWQAALRERDRLAEAILDIKVDTPADLMKQLNGYRSILGYPKSGELQCEEEVRSAFDAALSGLEAINGKNAPDPSGGKTAAAWAEARRIGDQINDGPDKSDVATEALMDQMLALDRAVLAATPVTAADAVAKLHACIKSMNDGEMGGEDRALAQVVAWIEGELTGLGKR
jgi:hypothetical protein